VAVGDLNGDGKLDLAVANENSENVSVLLGNGSGGFGVATNFAAGNAPFSVAVGDLNGDGKLDLAVANAGFNEVSVLLNTTPPPGVTCNGRPATIVGNNKANEIVGTPGNDVIHGRRIGLRPL